MKQNKKYKNCPIAVIGFACWYPGAKNVKQFWENTLARRAQFRYMPDVRLPLNEYYDPDPSVLDKTYCNHAGLIDGFDFDWAKHMIPKTTFISSDIVHWLALEIAIQAMENAGLSLQTVPNDRTGVIVGNTLTGEYSRSEMMRERWPYFKRALTEAARNQGLKDIMIDALTVGVEAYFKSNFPPATEDTLAGHLSNTIASRICNHFDLHGGGYTVDGACASSLVAIVTGANALKNGEMDLALIGGVDISLDPFELVGFARAGALTNGAMRVYDRRANGFIPGEGCGFVVLKRLEDARADGDYIYAVVQGWGISSDGKGAGFTAPNPRGQALAIRRAYERAPYNINAVDFIEGHGTGTPIGDKAELQALAMAIGDNGAQRSCGIGTIKSIIGHTKAASGIAGFIKTVLSVNRRVIPPTAGCIDPNPIFIKEAPQLYPLIRGRHCKMTQVVRAGVSAMGFGGINCHITIESGDEPSKALASSLDESTLMASYQETELFVFGAESMDNLHERLYMFIQQSDGISNGEMIDLAAMCAREVPVDAKARAAFVANSPRGLQKLYEKLNQNHIKDEALPFQLRQISTPDGLGLIGNNINRHRVAFLYPGQGSQQLNMGRMLIDRCVWARELIEQSAEWLSDFDLIPLKELIYRPTERIPDKECLETWQREIMATNVAQPAICLISLLWTQFLARLGIQPIAVAGHSLGELTAFHVAGAFSAKELLRFAAIRGEAMWSENGSSGVMAALNCSHQTAEGLIKGVSGYAVIANINSPNQVVISGEKPAVKDVIAHANDLGIHSKVLPVSNAFHSQLVGPAAEYLQKNIPIPRSFTEVKVPLFSCRNKYTVHKGINLHKHFITQVLAPVDFLSMVERLRSECDLMVEVGPGQVLSRLIRDINGEAGPHCLPIESQPCCDFDINTFLAHYFVCGGKISWDALYENRLVREFIPVKSRIFITNPCEQKFNVPVNTLPALSTIGTIETRIAEKASLSKEQFNNYLAIRGDFLADIIKADSTRLPELQAMPLSNVVPNDHSSAIPLLSKEPEAIETDNLSIEEQLHELVAQRTGFSKESISLENRLIDDLNLDSIKAASIIAEAAKQRGIAGKLDPIQYTNASLSAIADALRKVEKGSPGMVSFLQNHSKNESWVRNFIMKEMPEEIPAKDEDECLKYWQENHVLIICDAHEFGIAEACKTYLSQYGAEVEIIPFENVSEKIPMGAYHSLITILPRTIKRLENGIERIKCLINRLQSIVANVRSASIDGKLNNVTFIQWTIPKGNTLIENGCANALAATLHLEQPEIKVRALTFASSITTNDMVIHMAREIVVPGVYVRAIYHEDLKRYAPTPVVIEKGMYQPRPLLWSTQDVVLVTGGAKGITAECAFALASATGARMALVGRSQEPAESGEEIIHPEEPSTQRSVSEIKNTLERYRESGLTARYYQCNISDSNATAGLIKRITDEMGTISAVIHGAALNIPRTLDKVTPDQVFDEVAPKVCGILNLCNCLDNVPLKLLLGLSSIIGLTGMPRNGWYGFSNEVLDNLITGFGMKHPDTATISIAYSVWDEVGMGVRLGSTQALAHYGIEAIPLREGVARFLDLIANDPGHTQVGVTARMGSLDTLHRERMLLPPARRFLEHINFVYPRIETIASVHLTLEKDPYLHDHIWQGSYLFPTVFGLEAMAQAVAYVSGRHDLRAIRIEKINLKRPIVISPDKGTIIQIHATTIERESQQEPLSVKAAITTEQTGYEIPHFSATFVFTEPKGPLFEEINLPSEPLAIKPKIDLYGSILFQGDRFQRLKKIYELDSTHCIYNVEVDATAHEGELSSCDEQVWLLGDPYYRDALLQSTQLLSPQGIGLPIGIAHIQRYPNDKKLSNSLIGTTNGTFDHNDRQYHAFVQVINGHGQVIEQLSGYIANLLEVHKENPTAEELANPESRDKKLIKARLTALCASLKATAPQIEVAFMPDFNQLPKTERHKRELPLLRHITANVLENKDDADHIHFKWLKTGKPVLKNNSNNKVGISVTHDDMTLLCIAGKGLQGCDLEPITPRDKTMWHSILADSGIALLNKIISGGDTYDYAATRIWTAREASVKAFDSMNTFFSIEGKNHEGIIFKAMNSEKSVYVLTFPLKLTLGLEKMFAITIQLE